MPSINTFGVPLIVTTMMTRTNGMPAPPERRNKVCSGERLGIVKFSSKPLCESPEAAFTWMLVNASSTSRGTGTGTPGPIISVRWMGPGLAMARLNPRRQRDTDLAPDHIRELVRTQHAVRVAQAPELLRIAEIARRDVVEAVALGDGVLLQEREALRQRHEAAAHIDDRPAVGTGALRRRDIVVAAAWRKQRDLEHARRVERLHRIGHGRPPKPKLSSPTAASWPASRSFACR